MSDSNLNEYQRGVNDGLELAAIKVQNMLNVPFHVLTQMSNFIRELKLTQPATVEPSK